MKHEGSPDIDVVIPWFARPQLEQSLRENAETFARCVGTVIVVNGGGDPEELAGILQRVHLSNVRTLTVPGSPFSKSRCINAGVAASSARLIMLSDADIIFDLGFFSLARAACRPGRYVTVKHLVELDPESHPQERASAQSPFESQRVMSWLTFRTGQRVLMEHWQGPEGRAAPGLILVRRADFIKIGGANSELHGWGFEDHDIQIRLQARGSLRRTSVGRATHITHSVADPETRTESDKRNRQACTRNYREGNFLGTFPADLQALEEAGVIDAGLRAKSAQAAVPEVRQ